MDFLGLLPFKFLVEISLGRVERNLLEGGRVPATQSHAPDLPEHPPEYVAWAKPQAQAQA